MFEGKAVWYLRYRISLALLLAIFSPLFIIFPESPVRRKTRRHTPSLDFVLCPDFEYVSEFLHELDPRRLWENEGQGLKVEWEVISGSAYAPRHHGKSLPLKHTQYTFVG